MNTTYSKALEKYSNWVKGLTRWAPAAIGAIGGGLGGYQATKGEGGMSPVLGALGGAIAGGVGGRFLGGRVVNKALGRGGRHMAEAGIAGAGKLNYSKPAKSIKNWYTGKVMGKKDYIGSVASKYNRASKVTDPAALAKLQNPILTKNTTRSVQRHIARGGEPQQITEFAKPGLRSGNTYTEAVQNAPARLGVGGKSTIGLPGETVDATKEILKPKLLSGEWMKNNPALTGLGGLAAYSQFVKPEKKPMMMTPMGGMVQMG